MLQLINNTSFCAEKAALVGPDGDQFWVVIVKATYLLNEDGSIDPHPQPEPVWLSPRYSGEPGKSSLLREGEMVFDHPGTDVTLLATARAPYETPVRSLNVTVSVGSTTQTLRIFGDRFWQKGVFGFSMTEPEAFTAQPIMYERAYGGTNMVDKEAGQQEKEPRNPIGRGFASSAKTLIDKPLPNIEDPHHLIRSWSDRPQPVGLGPIASMWSPRLEYAGTFDDRWRNQRMPLWPEDYNPHQAQAAHPALVSEEPCRGGEQVMLTNLTRGSELRFRLPHPYLIFTTSTRTRRFLQKVQLDRIIIEPDAQRLVMVWRSSLNCGPRVRDILQTVVDEKPLRPKGVQKEVTSGL